MQTIVKKKIGFDNMSLSAKFISGATLKFSIGRRGEKLEIAFSNDPSIGKHQLSILSKWLKHRKDETNTQRFERLEQLCLSSRSGADLINKI